MNKLPTIELSSQQAIHLVDTTSFEILGPSTSFEEIASSISGGSDIQQQDGGGGDNSSSSIGNHNFLVQNEDKILEVPIAAVQLVGGGEGNQQQHPNPDESHDIDDHLNTTTTADGDGTTTFSSPCPLIVWAAPAPLEDEEHSRKRASLLSATIVRNSTEERLGLGLHMTTSKRGKPVLIISSVKPNGLLSDSPFRSGDRLVSINNVSCENMRKSEAATFLRNVCGTLTVIVQNDSGDTQLVESMIRKPTPTSKTGLAVVSNGYSRAQVSNIRPHGLFERSLLSRKDLILSVNNIPCQNLDSKEVADIVTRATDCVTIVAERKYENAVVVSMAQQHQQQHNDNNNNNAAAQQ